LLYVPGWAYAKWPEQAQGGGNFGYCVDASGPRQVIEKFLRTVVPMFKDKAARHSFCLSNEPNFSRSQDCANTRTLWTQYLARTHRTVAALNACYGSHYATFAEVPMPGLAQPEFYDYSRFNEERFAAWHGWMGKVIHSLAPQALVHAKIQLEGAVLSRWYHKSSWGVDPELFGESTDLNGNDDIILEPAAGSEWALAWQLQNLGYDIQRSLAAKPIFNSENHPTLDGYTGYVQPEHFRTALWQGAVHGQGATTIWVWERTADHANCLYGNVMDRPGCAQAVGVTCLDLNRFADEVSALQTVRAPVAILYSGTSIKPDRRYIRSVETTYTALNFSGIKLDFISEKQLLAGKGRGYKLLVIPDATQLQPQAVEVLSRLRGVRLALVGDGLAKDCYAKDTPAGTLAALRAKALLLDAKLSAKELRPALSRELAGLRALPEWRLVEAATDEPVWGVEWLPAKLKGRTIINAVNLLRHPVQVSILKGNRPVTATDLLSLGGREPVETLQPMVPVLCVPAK
jgi:beta-galactosidase GanA